MRRHGTDVGHVNETELSAPTEGASTEDEAPRLGSPPMLPNVPPVADPVLNSTPPLPLVSPVLSGDTPMLPVLPSPSLATARAELELPPALIDEVVASAPEARRHPMAHLMPEVPKPSEAALRAAKARAVRKRKAKRHKIIAAVVLIAVAAVAGPPAGRWLIDAIDEAGSTKSDTPETPSDSVPATTVSAVDAMLTTPPTTPTTATPTP
jgi:hypothetical protein